MPATVFDAAHFRRSLCEHAEFSALSEAELQTLLDGCTIVSHKLGETIVRAGEPGDAAFLISSGRVRVIREIDGRNITLATCTAGQLFGERAILTDEPRNATVRAADDLVLLKIPGAAFRAVVERNPSLKNYVNHLEQKRGAINFLRASALGRHLSVTQSVALLDNLQPTSFQSGDVIVQQGEPGDRLYLIEHGRVRVVTEDRPPTRAGNNGNGAVTNGRTQQIAELLPGDFFGERALLTDEPRGATVIASEDCRCFTLARSDFRELLETSPDLASRMQQRLEMYRAHEELNRKFGPKPASRRQLDFEDSAGGTTPTAATGMVDFDTSPAAARPFRKPRRLFRKFPLIRQLDETDCGAACLAMVSKFYGVSLRVGHLRDQASVGRDGASLYSLAAAAERLGYATRALRIDYERLRGVQAPAVVHWHGNHYVVVYKVLAKRVLVADPAGDLRWMPRSEFEAGWTGHALELTPTEALRENRSKKTTFRRFLPYLKPHRGLLVQILLASLILEMLELVGPVFSQIVIDRVLVHQNVNMLNLMLVGMVLMGVFQSVVSLIRDYLSVHLAEKLRLRFSSDLLRQMMQLPLRFFQTRRIGDVMQRFEDNDEIQDVLTGKVLGTILDALTIVLTLALMLYYSPPLTAIALCTLPVYVVLTLSFTPALKRQNLAAVEQSAAASSHLVELFKSLVTVKSAAAEDTVRWRQENHLVREANIGFREARLDLWMTGLSSAIDIFARLLLFWYGAHLVIQGQLTVGQLVAFQVLVGMVLGPIMGLIGLWDELQEALLSLHRLADVHDCETEQPQGTTAVRLPRLRGGIRFQNVSFRYNLDDADILAGINLEIDPGSTVALVGRSGSGKTTLVNLLQRFYKPVTGTVSIDGHVLSTVDVRSLREQLGVVPQSPEILLGTIRDNIALGDPQASMDRVMFAARLAGAHDFIAPLPMGYETVVGESGMGLSGGQKQRLAIARALLNDPAIVVFDEATSALDAETEHLIQSNLQAILHDRTAIIVAHRLSTIRHADLIVVLDGGRIIEQGTHEQLLQQCGLYYHLVSQQLSF